MGIRTSRRDQRYRLLLLVAAVFTAVAFLPGVAATGVAPGPNGGLDGMIAADRVRVTTGWSTVEFPEPFAEAPIVVAGPASWAGRDPATVRVRNVTASSFQVRLTEWPYLDGNHMYETVSYLAVPAGVHELPSGGAVEAGSIWVPVGGTTDSFGASFIGPPAMAATLMASGAGPALAVRPAVTASGFFMRLRPEEADSSSYSGRVNWIAWSDGSGTATEDGIAWETRQQLIDNSFERIRFDRAYSKPCVLAAMNTRNGGDTANLRYRRLAVRSIELRIDEERSANPEVAHTNERVGAIIVECAHNPPTIWPRFVFGATLVGSPTVLSGFVSDNEPVDRVSVAIRRRMDGTWLQTDGSFGTKVQRFAADGSYNMWPFGDWRHDVDLPEGDYSLSLRVWDADGNHAFLVPWRHFSVVAPSAVGAVLTPGTGYTSIELDAAGNPVIAYTTTDTLNVIHCDDPGCNTFAGPFAVSADGFAPEDGVEEWGAIDLELDAAGIPVIQAGSLVHCVDPDCEQPPSVAPVSPGDGASLELDANGYPVSTGAGLTVIHCTDPNCADPPQYGGGLPFNEILWTSLALDGAGNPVIATWDRFGSLDPTGALVLTRCADPNCQDPASHRFLEGGFSEVDKSVALVLDGSDNPIIAAKQVDPDAPWVDPDGYEFDRLRVISCSDADCAGPFTTAEISDDVGAGIHSSLALSPEGRPVVSYDLQGSLAVARCTDVACAAPPELTVVAIGDGRALWTSLAVNGDGVAYVSFVNGRGDLMFARVPAP